jgi:molybdopterin molybdotransferase
MDFDGDLVDRGSGHHMQLGVIHEPLHRGLELRVRSAGRYLAEAVLAPRPIPAHDNAAVDGYSFAYASYDKAQGMRFKVSGEASAGHPYAAVPPADGTVRIFTGAVMPSGHDTVAMQEFVDVEERDGEWFATIQGGLKHGANRRLAGEDSEEGNVLVKPGTRGFE